MAVKGHSDAGTSCSRQWPTGNSCSCVLELTYDCELKKERNMSIEFFFKPRCFEKGKNWLMRSSLWVTSLRNILLQKQVIWFSQCHVFSHSVSQIKARPCLRSSATSRESIQHQYVPIGNVYVRWSYASRRERRLYCLTCSFLPPAERCELSAAVVGGVRDVLWEAHRCAVTGSSTVSRNTCLCCTHTTRPAAPTGFYSPKAGWPLTLCGDMVLTCLCFV